MTETTPLLIHVAERVGWITLHRPQQRNALNDALMDAPCLLAFFIAACA